MARPQSMHVFTAALRCVPYIMPEHWVGGRLMDDLPGESEAAYCTQCIGMYITQQDHQEGSKTLEASPDAT